MSGSVRLGIIGYGNIGSAHAACIASGRIEGLTLHAICDINPDRLAAAQERHPGVLLTCDWRELVDGSDAVIVSVPHPLHSAIAAHALRAQRHVLVEKPLDVSLAAARQAVQAAQEGKQVFAVMLNQRTNPLFQRAREIVRSGELGEIKRSVWIITNWYRTQHYYDSGSWRATWAGEGGGVLLNQAPHNLDLWQWICGMPVTVQAQCDVARYHRIEVEDDATLSVRYANGATGLFITSTGEFPGTNRLEISGTRGKMVLEDRKIRLWLLQEDEAVFRYASEESFASIPMTCTEEAFPDDGPAHAGILQNFTNAILHGEALISPGADGLAELTLSNAAYLSQWQGGREIALPMDEALFERELARRAAASAYHGQAQSDAPSARYIERWQTRW